ncbi:MAG: metallophosphoesterase [Lentisphaeria bacterium]|nr:metallophosphoesterase [Lentisphaeria bacterium]
MRKRFFIFSALFALLCAAGTGESYSFFMISDPHLGAASTYCTDPAVPKKFRTKKDIHRADKCMPAFKAMFEDMAKKTGENTRFLFEAGDLIEGGTKGEEVHKQVLTDAVGLLKKYFRIPIYMVKGNHEAYGMGGEAAHRAVLLPELAKTAGLEKLDFTNYTVAAGGDLYIFLDCYSGAKAKPWEFLGKTLKSLDRKPRYVFVGMHGPVIPSHWNQKEIRTVLDQLLEYDAVLLCGHCHQNSVTVYEKNGKKLVQVTVSTYLEPKKKMLLHPAENTKDQLLARFRDSLKGRWKKADFLPEFEREWAPYITDYRNFGGAGYARFDVSDAGISVTYQSAVLNQKPQTFLLRGKEEK